VRGAGILVAAVLLAPAAARGEASVHSAGCHTTVTTKIEISGAGASKTVARRIRAGIQGCSPGKVGGYSLLGCCKVFTKATVRVRRRGRGPRPGYNQIDITNEADFRSYVDGGQDSGKWSSAEDGEVYAHETGHLLGLDDQYDDVTDANGNTFSKTRPGHEMDKMGAKGGKLGVGAAARGDLDRLLLDKGARCNPVRCCRRTTTTTMPPATWTGTFKYVYTDDEMGSASDAAGSYTKNNHMRTEDMWTINGTTAAMPPSVTVDTTWMGTFTSMTQETTQRPFCIGQETARSSSSSGTGTGQQQFMISPTDQDPNQYTIAYIPSTPLNRIHLTGSTHVELCGVPPSDTAIDGYWDDGVSQLVNSLPVLAPDPGDPDHYAGRAPFTHIEMPGIGGAPHVTDSYAEWDLRRHR